MARFLFVIVPVVAHVWPAVAIGDELAARGHEVAWCGPDTDLRPLVGPDVPIFPTGKRSFRQITHSGTEAVRQLWDEYVLPLNRFLAEPVDQAVAEYRPDIIVADQYALAGALAACQRGVRWATLCAGVLRSPRPTTTPAWPTGSRASSRRPGRARACPLTKALTCASRRTWCSRPAPER